MNFREDLFQAVGLGAAPYAGQHVRGGIRPARPDAL
jgi:hypothetical protein